VFLGIDDTDSRTGMCTTYVGLRAILKLIDMGYDIIGYPNLVRLNPNVPWKTRGNGSVVIRFGVGKGSKLKIGEYEGESIFAYSHGSDDVKVKIESIAKHIERFFVLSDENTNPGMVLTSKKLPEWLYWKGVREILDLTMVEETLKKYNAKYIKYKLGRGIIGASCGIAWGKKRKTYELLTYTSSNYRFVDSDSVKEMDKAIKSTFDNYDYLNNYVAIMPNSATPVLYGIRGTIVEELVKAMSMIKSSEYNAYLIYETNQGTDDHLVRKKISEVKNYESVIVRGTVFSNPRRIVGGHVIFKIRDDTGVIECAAYEPTKQFRNVIEKLRIGDEVEVYGGIRGDRVTINIEKIKIMKVPEMREKLSNPVCPKCGRKMESVGRGKGYRCRKCGTRAGEDAAIYRIVPREIKTGFYEVPVIARRHLAEPLKLIKENIF